MGNEKTPLVQKLILGVLTLILLCLVILIAQNRSRHVGPLAQPEQSPEQIVAEQPSPELPSASKQPTGPARLVPTRVAVEPASETPVQSAALPVVSHPQSQPPPEPYTTLVNPVGRAAVDIIVRPESELLKTELCGRVRLEGNPPPEVPIRLDARCQRFHDQPLITRHYVVGPEGGLANVLVYIKEGLPPSATDPRNTNAFLKIEGCLFEPYVMGLQAGQKFTIQNSDNILHNFHATAKHNKEFNISIPKRGEIARRSFDNPEVFVRLKCDVHPWEFSYVGVVSHPFFAVTDTNGVFCLPPGLPHGRYVLAAAHPKSGETLKEIVIHDDAPNPIDLAVRVRR